MYFRRILAEGQFLHCPLSNAHSFTITAPRISFGDKFFKISESQIVLVFALFTGKLVVITPRFHAYIVTV